MTNEIPKTVNIFFLRHGYYEAILTTADDIKMPNGHESRPYDRKVTLDLEPAQEWDKGTYVGTMGSCSIPEHVIKGKHAVGNEDYRYVRADKFLFDKDYVLYMAVHTMYLDGKEHYSKSIDERMETSSCQSFLFPKNKKPLL